MVPTEWLCTALLAICTSLAVSLLLFLKKQNQYWEERGVPGPKPSIFFGNVKDSVLVKITVAEEVQKIVDQYKDEKVIGLFNLWKPVLLVKEWDVAKIVLEKEAEHFLDHPPILSKELTDYAFYSLLTMEGEEWKTRRHVFSKLFTPRKLKDYLEDMRPGLRTFLGKLDGDVECVDTLADFTAQAITMSLYGLDLSNDPKRTEEIVKMVTYFMHPPRSTIIKMITYTIVPGLFRVLRLGVMPVAVWEYARKLLDGLVGARTTLKSDRDDGLSLIIKLLDEGVPAFGKIEYKEAVGHMFQFLVGGIHTSAVVMSHVMLKLAQYPEIQEKVRQEVEQVLEGSKEITYEHLAEMKYLESVIDETTRLAPLLGIHKRKCTKEYVLEEKITIPKGMDVWVDTYGIQRDPRLFPEPDLFIPERWLDGRAEPAALIPFGKGPRICIGKRLAEVQMKLLLSTVVSKFHLLPSSKNRVPPKFNPKTVLITSTLEGGFWVIFRPRN